MSQIINGVTIQLFLHHCKFCTIFALGICQNIPKVSKNDLQTSLAIQVTNLFLYIGINIRKPTSPAVVITIRQILNHQFYQMCRFTEHVLLSVLKQSVLIVFFTIFVHFPKKSFIKSLSQNLLLWRKVTRLIMLNTKLRILS